MRKIAERVGCWTGGPADDGTRVYLTASPVTGGRYVVVDTPGLSLYFLRSIAGWSSLVARRAHNPKVAGSNPAPAISRAPQWPDACGKRSPSDGEFDAELPRVRYVEPACGGERGRALKRRPLRCDPPSEPNQRLGRFFFAGQVAQLVEHMTENHGVGGSIPPLAIREDIKLNKGSVAQLGRAPVSKTGGWGFDSLRARSGRRSTAPVV